LAVLEIMMNLYLCRRRRLRIIERHLTRSDPDLDELFCGFTELVRDKLMPDTEKTRTHLLWWGGWLGRRSDHRRAV
jgi:hypothetical protein